ncbi:MAG TPA: prepilin-type N-terminal cleavage/methylation domain-containing protein, partial [Polyangiales bacterium]
MAMNRKGFTLVELMIAMVAGSFAVAGVYYLNGVSARAMSQQMSVSDAQMSLRSAMEQIRRDVARAGYLAAPNSDALYNCLGTVVAGSSDVTQQAFQAVRVGKDGSLSYGTTSGPQVAALLGTNKVAADDLTLIGNFATADAYLADPANTTASVITLQTTSESFRRSFFTPGATNAVAATANTALFSATFAPGRMLRIEQGGRFYFRNIQNRAWTSG